MSETESSCPAVLLLPEGPVGDTPAVLAAARSLPPRDPRRPGIGTVLEHLLEHDETGRPEVCRALVELAPERRGAAADRLRRYLADPQGDPVVARNSFYREWPEGYEPLPTLIGLALLDESERPAAVDRYRACSPHHQSGAAGSYALLGPEQRVEAIERQRTIAAAGNRWQVGAAVRTLLAFGPEAHLTAREVADRALARGVVVGLGALARPLTELHPQFVPHAVAIALGSLELAPQEFLGRRGLDLQDVPTLVFEAGPAYHGELRRVLLALARDERRAPVLRWRAAVRLQLLGEAERTTAEAQLRRAGVADPEAAPPVERLDEEQRARVRARVAAAWQRIEAALRRRAPELLAGLGAPATPEQIAAAERELARSLPVDFAASLAVHGSVALVGTEELGGAGEPAPVAHGELAALLAARADQGDWTGEQPDDAVRRDWGWRPGWLPLSDGPDGSLLVLDLEPGRTGRYGQLVHADQGTPDTVLHPGWVEALEAFADGLEG
ncbi:SMI1/KNR4 family protein [Kitasatospora sp. NPDC058965]|uniref:SMI1/KNR4 family protein n=1 Tax=Kitasatospora sp. NPDC058965 TaxID=3346682 RepID=UPI00368BEA9B